MFAGAACSVGFWMLLQLLGVGIGLAAVDVGSVDSLRGVGVGTTAWSLVSPLIAMFFGGLIAGKLAQTFDRKIAGVHGLVMWAMTSILGLCATIWIVTMVVAGAARVGGVAIDATGRMISPSADLDDRAPTLRGLGLDADDLLGPVNERLQAQTKPTITAAELETSVRGVVRSGITRGDFDQELLVDQLVANTRLSRADAIDVERQLEARVGGSDPRAHHIERRAERYALAAVDASGKALTTVGFSLLLSLLTSVIGAMVALRRGRRSGEAGTFSGVRTTEPGFATPPTEPVPAVPHTDIGPR